MTNIEISDIIRLNINMCNIIYKYNDWSLDTLENIINDYRDNKIDLYDPVKNLLKAFKYGYYGFYIKNLIESISIITDNILLNDISRISDMYGNIYIKFKKYKFNYVKDEMINWDHLQKFPDI
jgi:hypothetical protein